MKFSKVVKKVVLSFSLIFSSFLLFNQVTEAEKIEFNLKGHASSENARVCTCNGLNAKKIIYDNSNSISGLVRQAAEQFPEHCVVKVFIEDKSWHPGFVGRTYFDANDERPLSSVVTLHEDNSPYDLHVVLEFNMVWDYEPAEEPSSEPLPALLERNPSYISKYATGEVRCGKLERCHATAGDMESGLSVIQRLFPDVDNETIKDRLTKNKLDLTSTRRQLTYEKHLRTLHGRYPNISMDDIILVYLALKVNPDHCPTDMLGINYINVENFFDEVLPLLKNEAPHLSDHDLIVCFKAKKGDFTATVQFLRTYRQK